MVLVVYVPAERKQSLQSSFDMCKGSFKCSPPSTQEEEHLLAQVAEERGSILRVGMTALDNGSCDVVGVKRSCAEAEL